MRHNVDEQTVVTGNVCRAGTLTETLSRGFDISRAFGLFGLLALCFLISACSDTVLPPPPSTDPNTGSLQVTVSGLPPEAEANVTVTGPNDYSAEVERSRTLTGLPTGRYTVTVSSVVFSGETFPGTLPGSRASTELDVTRQAVSEVLVSYFSVGVVGAGELAPGVTRSGTLSVGAFDEYTFSGVEGVPLAFDFEGTREASPAVYSVNIYASTDLQTPLYSVRFGTANADPIVGFAPPATGGYVLRIGNEQNVLIYTVTASYLSGTPEERATPARLTMGELVRGAVTAESSDSYLFSATANEAVTLVFDYEEGGGIYDVEIVSASGGEPLYSERYGTALFPPEIPFTAPETGDYLVRVRGVDTVIRYSLVLRK